MIGCDSWWRSQLLHALLPILALGFLACVPQAALEPSTPIGVATAVSTAEPVATSTPRPTPTPTPTDVPPGVEIFQPEAVYSGQTEGPMQGGVMSLYRTPANRLMIITYKAGVKESVIMRPSPANQGNIFVAGGLDIKIEAPDSNPMRIVATLKDGVLSGQLSWPMFSAIEIPFALAYKGKTEVLLAEFNRVFQNLYTLEASRDRLRTICDCRP